METEILSHQQQKAVKLFLEGKNLFISGGAGSGKSFLLNFLRKNYSNSSNQTLQITASTGISAVNIGGVTIHSFAGIGLANQPIEKICSDIFSTKFSKIRKRIQSTKSLAIDEISMISGRVLEILNQVFQAVRGNKKPMGGMQILLFGDFLQLPPIIDYQSGNQDFDFCYNSKIWQELDLHNIIFEGSYRQSDKKFIDLLNNIRIGKISENDKKILDSRIKKFDPHSFIKPTILTTHNQKVENVNHQFLKQIPDKEFIFDAKYQGEDSKIEFLKKNCLAYQRLVLKVGAQVMMIKNTLSKEGIINGSIGVIRDFSIKKNYPIVEFANSKTFTIVPEEWQVEKFDHDLGTTKIEASLSQIPLILAWAITIHKSQGLTLDKISCDLSNCFSPGQAYVALSRAKNIEGIFIESLNYSKIYANQEAVEFYNKIISHD